MGINTTLLNGIRENAYDYGINFPELEEFLVNIPHDFQNRQAKAIEIIEGIMTVHGKKELLGHIAQLASVEYGIRELNPSARDHVVHALLSFFLGVYINEHFLKPSGQAVDAFQWKLACLFHDIGYPAQIAHSILRSYTDQLNNIKRDLSFNRPDIYFSAVPVGLEKLSNRVNALDLIQQRLNTWGVDVNAKREYKTMVKSGRVCHGMISSLPVLYIVDMMYQKYNPRRAYVDNYEPQGINWNQSYFENDVVAACAAVFLHNLPARCFRSAPLDRNRAALPYLLRLSDSLQDWERPSANDPMGLPESAFDIDILLGRLIFKVGDTDRRSQIKEEIELAISASDIDIM